MKRHILNFVVFLTDTSRTWSHADYSASALKIAVPSPTHYHKTYARSQKV